MASTQIRQCRATGGLVYDDESQRTPSIKQAGVPAGTIAAGGFLQTDFACCSSEDFMNHLKDRDLRNGVSKHGSEKWVHGADPDGYRNYLTKHKIAGCEWDYTIYKETDAASGGPPGDGNVYPVVADGPYVKLGAASGRCHLNADSEACSAAFCEDMVVTVQGGLYVTIAYSQEMGNMIQAPEDDNCRNLYFINDLNNEFGEPSTADRREAIKKKMGWGPGGNNKAGNTTHGPLGFRASDVNYGSAVYKLWNDVMNNLQESDLFKRAEREIGAWGASKTASVRRAARGLAGGTFDGEPDRDSEPGLFGGLAVVIMGETSISSLSGDLRVESAGHVEYTPLFLSWARGLSADYEYPFVDGGGIKLWFKEKSGRDEL